MRQKSCKNASMREITSSELAELRRIVNLLIDVIDHLEDTPVTVPPDIQKQVEENVSNRICLACGSAIPDGVEIKRGQESSCYNTTRKRIRMGIYRERQLIEQGKLTAEKALPGRPAKQDRTQEEKARMVAEDLAAYKAKKAKRKNSDG